MENSDLKIETIVKKKDTIRCPKCNSNAYVIKIVNNEIMCLNCFKKRFPEIYKQNTIQKELRPRNRKPFRKLTKEQIELIRKNIKDYRKSLGKLKILYGGCFK